MANRETHPSGKGIQPRSADRGTMKPEAKRDVAAAAPVPGPQNREQSAPAKGGSGRLTGWVRHLDYSRTVSMAATLALVNVVGVVDFLTGYQLYFFAFYLAPVALAVWNVDSFCGIFTSILCVTVWVVGDLVAGANYSSFVVIWNAMIALTSYLVVVLILSKLRSLQRNLEERVRQRTTALRAEMHERMRLEEEILRISEYEQRRIGHDLHDSLCQHLTGTALAGQVLSERLAARSLPEAAATNQIVELLEEAIELTRKLARGLHPVDLSGDGLVDAFQELASNITERFKISCRFEGAQTPVVLHPEGPIHLYRIAQEAISNAIRHGKARNIVIWFGVINQTAALTVTDDGVGVRIPSTGGGMGLRIMAYRAGMIGATFNIVPLASRGTRVSCTLAADCAPPLADHAPQM